MFTAINSTYLPLVYHLYALKRNVYTRVGKQFSNSIREKETGRRIKEKRERQTQTERQ